MEGCMACELTTGVRPLPAGVVHETRSWLIEHCVGPFGLGALVVKPRRHVTNVAALTDDEAVELGPLLRRTSTIAGQLVDAEQTYNCLWSHAGGVPVPVHVHYVIHPVTAKQMVEFDAHGPSLQVAMFARGETPPASEVEAIADRARQRFEHS